MPVCFIKLQDYLYKEMVLEELFVSHLKQMMHNHQSPFIPIIHLHRQLLMVIIGLLDKIHGVLVLLILALGARLVQVKIVL